MESEEHPKSNKTSFLSGDVLGAFVLGLISSVPILVLIYVFLLRELEEAAKIAAYVAVGAGIASVFAIIFLRVILRKIFGNEAPSGKTIFDNAAASVAAIESGDFNQARKELGSAASDALGLYSWLTGRQWITTIFLGSIGLFAGSASTYIFIQQNSILTVQSNLLEEQERLLRTQSIFMRDAMLSQDALRYVPLYSDLSQVLEEIRVEGLDRSGLSEDFHLVRLSPELSSRIVNLTRTFRPYWLFDSFSGFDRDGANVSAESPSPNMVFLSPERGMLLKAIVESRVELHDPTLADFTYSDMRGFDISGLHIGDDWHFHDLIDYGACYHSRSPATMYWPDAAYERADGQRVIDEYVQGGNGNALYKYSFYEMRIEHSDFSHSVLRGVHFLDQMGTLRFEGSTLVNVEFHTRNRLNLSGAIIGTVGIERQLGTISVEILGQNALFSGLICPEGIDFGDASTGYDSEQDLEEVDRIYNATLVLVDQNFDGALFGAYYVSSGLFSDLSIASDAERLLRDPNPFNDVCYVPMRSPFVSETPSLGDWVEREECFLPE